MKKFNLAPALTVALIASVASPARALFTFDDFSGPVVNLTATSSGTFYDSFTQSPSLFMGSRLTTLYQSDSPGPGSSSLAINNGLFLSSSSSVRPYAQLAYGIARLDAGTGTVWYTNANNVNLYHLTEMQFQVASASSGTQLYLQIRSNFFNQIEYRVDILEEVVTPTTFKINLLDPISGNHALRFDTDTFTVGIVAPAGGHANLSRIQAVPEPGTMLALGAGLAALSARRKRKA